MARRRYSDRDRIYALRVLDASKGDLTRAARAAGIPRTTLYEWAHGRVSAEVNHALVSKRLTDHLREVGQQISVLTDEMIAGASDDELKMAETDVQGFVAALEGWIQSLAAERTQRAKVVKPLRAIHSNRGPFS